MILTDAKTDPFRFIAFGCHGSAEEQQYEVANYMNRTLGEIQKAGEPMPSAVFTLGDNLYDYGTPKPKHSLFTECFHKIYYSAALPLLNQLKIFLLPGNHDGNQHTFAWLSSNPSGEATSINEAAHSYIDDLNVYVQDKKSPDNVSLAKLPHWNMPGLFYSVIAGNTQTFFVDSNHLLKDYILLNTKGGTITFPDGSIHNATPVIFYDEDDASRDDPEKGIKVYPLNQAASLQEKVAAAVAAKRRVIITKHHPNEVYAKRKYKKKYDTEHYIDEAQVTALLAILNEGIEKNDPNYVVTTSYTDLLVIVQQRLGIVPDLSLAAHEHLAAWRWKLHEAPQFTCGIGGGDKLDMRESYIDPNVGPLLQRFGFAIVTCDPVDKAKFTIDLYSLDPFLTEKALKAMDPALQAVVKKDPLHPQRPLEGLHLRFNESSKLPLTENSADPQVNTLRDCVLAACNEYFSFMRAEEVKNPQRTPLKRVQELFEKKPGWLYSLFAPIIKPIINPFKALFRIPEEIDVENCAVQDIQAYFYQVKLPDMPAVLEYLHGLTRQLPFRKSENQSEFYHVLEKTCKEQGINLQTLFDVAGLKDEGQEKPLQVGVTSLKPA